MKEYDMTQPVEEPVESDDVAADGADATDTAEGDMVGDGGD